MENVEDNKAQGAMDLQNLNFSNRDVLVGLAASGRTPYVIGAMEYAP
ncbi:N-acetylmuramic acid 6-phosphate etherase [Klebsiella pneumoniae subsp. pneumoniae]|nr:N-acetylmuramic acid 6-phosphate etherase [Klebsiella pneumoniae subsp. pneumoniae]